MFRQENIPVQKGEYRQNSEQCSSKKRQVPTTILAILESFQNDVSNVSIVSCPIYRSFDFLLIRNQNKFTYSWWPLKGLQRLKERNIHQFCHLAHNFF